MERGNGKERAREKTGKGKGNTKNEARKGEGDKKRGKRRKGKKNGRGEREEFCTVADDFFLRKTSGLDYNTVRCNSDANSGVQSAADDAATFSYLDVSPRPSSSQHVHQFEDVVYWVKLQVRAGSVPAKFVVEVYEPTLNCRRLHFAKSAELW